MQNTSIKQMKLQAPSYTIDFYRPFTEVLPLYYQKQPGGFNEFTYFTFPYFHRNRKLVVDSRLPPEIFVPQENVPTLWQNL